MCIAGRLVRLRIQSRRACIYTYMYVRTYVYIYKYICIFTSGLMSLRLRTGSLESQRGLLQFNSRKVSRISHELITYYVPRTHYILCATNSKHFGSLDSSVRHPELEVETFQSKAVSWKVRRNTEMVIVKLRLPRVGC